MIVYLWISFSGLHKHKTFAVVITVFCVLCNAGKVKWS